jgi:hypothetical protein
MNMAKRRSATNRILQQTPIAPPEAFTGKITVLYAFVFYSTYHYVSVLGSLDWDCSPVNHDQPAQIRREIA